MTYKVVIPGGNFPEEEYLKETGAEIIRAGSPYTGCRVGTI